MKALKIIVLMMLVAVNQCTAEGFLAGTLVKTESGHVPIETLDRGSAVLSFEREKYHAHSILSCARSFVDHYVLITLPKLSLGAALDQKFYLVRKRKWVSAGDLNEGDWILARDGRPLEVIYTTIVYEPAELYALSIEESHTYCVSSCDVVVHNVLPAIGVGLGWAFGAGGIKFLGATIVAGFAGLGALIGLKVLKHHNKMKFVPQYNGADMHMPNPDGKGPKKDDAEKKHPHGKFHHTAKHHQNSKGPASPAPIDGQKALDNSVELNNRSLSRIGVSCNEIVELKKTAQGLYHGYVVSLDELEDHVVKLLRKNGLIDKAGNILR